jgi:hypothetical protein
MTIGDIVFFSGMGTFVLTFIVGMIIFALMCLDKIEFGPPPKFLWIGCYGGLAVGVLGIIISAFSQ